MKKNDLLLMSPRIQPEVFSDARDNMRVVIKILCTSCLLFGLMMCTSLTHANSETSELWECTSVDFAKMQWRVKASYQRVATNLALDACKKRSAYPHSCKITEHSCDVAILGHSSRSLWRCTALDSLAKVWKSGIYNNAEEAALASRAYCHQHSGLPSTCYTYVLMCKNYHFKG
jgi:hypothetical protein